MKYLVNDLRSGVVSVEDAPAPRVRRGYVLVQTRASLVSAGTERMLVEFGRASLLGKARAQPDKVKQVLERLQSDGILPTLETVFRRLDEPLPLGYCNAGTVIEVGPGVTELRPGDRVVSNGGHAELVCVPKNLCASIPASVSDDSAAFTVLSSIGLQGVRLLRPELGERVVVYGLGLIGLVSVQLLRASGCAVLGIDVNRQRLALAQRFGASVCNPTEAADVVAAAQEFCGGRGADGVIIAASAKSDEIVHNAARMCRKRGRIVLVGSVGLSLQRADFYEKELTFQVSCSYGPGRYDPAYEEGGQDYPLGFVRWTEQRNFEAILDAMAAGTLDVASLISARVPLAEAPAVYSEKLADPKVLGVVLEYPGQVSPSPSLELRPRWAGASGATVAVLGAGNFSKMTLLPALSRTPARIKYVCDPHASAAADLARKYAGVERAVSDHRLVLKDPEVDAVILAVGHHLHAPLVVESLAAGKHVFVEKPLALNVEELADILAALARAPSCQLMVGYNRRFSEHVRNIKRALVGRSEPLAMHMTVNAGQIPADHWVHDPARGGGRIIGEGCHFIDLLSHLADSPVVRVGCEMFGRGPSVKDDKAAITLAFEDGSVGSISYFANGSRAYGKELLEVFSDGRVFRLENFRRVVSYGGPRAGGLIALSQDKGHAAEFSAFIESLKSGGGPLIPLEQLVNASLASFAAVRSALERRTIDLKEEYTPVLKARAAGGETTQGGEIAEAKG
jgi:predicted dehydrogenase/NADPH:quinone reductase-like Zn-dependent oxidoreductase